MKMNSKRKKLVLVFAVLFIAWFLVSIYIGGKHQEQRLYKHGFRLLEEQVGTYVIEHYSGVEKVEFSPIFIDTDGMFTAKVVPVIYDLHGNKAYLGRPVKGGKKWL